MSKIANSIVDFLAVIGDHKEYDKHNWNWDNLPAFDKMWEIMETHRGDKR